MGRFDTIISTLTVTIQTQHWLQQCFFVFKRGFVQTSWTPCYGCGRQIIFMYDLHVFLYHILFILSAVIDLNGRFFGGRTVKACFYNLDKFRRLDLADEIIDWNKIYNLIEAACNKSGIMKIRYITMITEEFPKEDIVNTSSVICWLEVTCVWITRFEDFIFYSCTSWIKLKIWSDVWSSIIKCK